jgi:hypothetical protein
LSLDTRLRVALLSRRHLSAPLPLYSVRDLGSTEQNSREPKSGGAQGLRDRAAYRDKEGQRGSGTGGSTEQNSREAKSGGAQGLRDRAAERDREGQRDSGRGGLGVYGTERHRRLLCHCPSLPLTVPVFVVVQKSVPTGTRRRKNKKRRIAGVTGGGVGGAPTAVGASKQLPTPAAAAGGG